MNRYCTFALPFVFALIAMTLTGCGDDKQSKGSEFKVVQMGDDTMITKGNDWLFRFTRDGKPCVIVGDEVPFKEQTPELLVVDLRGGVFVNVPTNGLHPVLLINMDGINPIKFDQSNFSDDKELLKAILKEHQAEETKNLKFGR